MKLGINGLGRIGKLSLWHHVARKHFSEIVVNVGRDVGCSLGDIAGVIERDSTYGRVGTYLYGCKAPASVISDLDEAAGTMKVDGVPVKILRQARNPKDIAWKENGVRLVVDTTGAFTDPTADADAPRGSLRGHFQGGAEKVLLSAPFKIKQKGIEMPGDAVTTVMGINDGDYDPGRHILVSAASCTTTCLSFMVKPLLDYFGADKFLSASMVTVHAATGSQPVLDRVPGSRSHRPAQEPQYFKQHHPHLHRRGQGPASGDPRDEEDRFHCRIGASSHLQRLADHPGGQLSG
jgi:glyceraldehyde 3-phosphate dehydrogenase